MSTITERATEAFRKKLRERIKGIPYCWSGHLKTQLRIINAAILSARNLNATAATPLTAQEIIEAVDQLSPLCELEMREDVLGVLVTLMRNKGVSEEELGEELTS